MLISLLIPLVTSLLFSLLNGGAFNQHSVYPMIQMIITMACSVAALLFATRTKFYTEYKIIFFWSNTAFFFLTIFIGPFSKWIDPMLLGTILQTIYQITVIVLAFFLIKGFRENIFNGFKTSWLTILIATMVAVPLMYLWSWAMSKTGLAESVNQNSIVDLIQTANDNLLSKIFIFILLFLFVVVAAPIFEEMIARYFIAVFSGNRWVTLAISTIAFATMHTTASGDFIGLPIYIFGSFLMSLAFTLFGSLSHSIIIHITWNLISYILLVISNS